MARLLRGARHLGNMALGLDGARLADAPGPHAEVVITPRHGWSSVGSAMCGRENPAFVQRVSAWCGQDMVPADKILQQYRAKPTPKRQRFYLALGLLGCGAGGVFCAPI